MYEQYFDNYDPTYIDKLIAAAVDGVSVNLNYPGFGKGVTFNKAQNIGYITGYFGDVDGTTFVQVRLTDKILVDGTYYEWAFVNPAYTYIVTAQTSSLAQKAQSEVNEMIGYNKIIMDNNLLCSRIVNYCFENGIALPATARQQLYTLHNALLARNERLKTSGYVKDIKESQSPLMSFYNNELVGFMNNPGVGFIITTTAVLIIAAIVIASTVAVSYALFHKDNAEAKVHFKYSNELTAQLVKFLPPATYAQLMKENEANEKIANDAIAGASKDSMIKYAKYLGIGILAIWGFDKFNNILSRNK